MTIPPLEDSGLLYLMLTLWEGALTRCSSGATGCCCAGGTGWTCAASCAGCTVCLLGPGTPLTDLIETTVVLFLELSWLNSGEFWGALVERGGLFLSVKSRGIVVLLLSAWVVSSSLVLMSMLVVSFVTCIISSLSISMSISMVSSKVTTSGWENTSFGKSSS